MSPKNVEAAVDALEKALNRGEPVGAYLACASVLRALLEMCYQDAGMTVPPQEELFAGLAQTRLGQAFLPNLEAYARLCTRLDGVRPGREAGTFPQVTDARRLLARMMDA